MYVTPTWVPKQSFSKSTWSSKWRILFTPTFFSWGLKTIIFPRFRTVISSFSYYVNYIQRIHSFTDWYRNFSRSQTDSSNFIVVFFRTFLRFCFFLFQEYDLLLFNRRKKKIVNLLKNFHLIFSLYFLKDLVIFSMFSNASLQITIE